MLTLCKIFVYNVTINYLQLLLHRCCDNYAIHYYRLLNKGKEIRKANYYDNFNKSTALVGLYDNRLHLDYKFNYNSQVCEKSLECT